MPLGSPRYSGSSFAFKASLDSAGLQLASHSRARFLRWVSVTVDWYGLIDRDWYEFTHWQLANSGY